jgi:hypothetical protein
MRDATWPADPELFGLVAWPAWVCWRRDHGQWTAQVGDDDQARAPELADACGATLVLPRGQQPPALNLQARPWSQP